MSTKQADTNHPLKVKAKRKRKPNPTIQLGFLDHSLASANRAREASPKGQESNPIKAANKNYNGSPLASQASSLKPEDSLSRGTSLFRQRSKAIMESIVLVKPHVVGFWQGLYGRVSGFVKRQDIYGRPVALNYQGEETYKTCPGGCLTLLLFFTILCYFVLKFKYMIFKEEWQLIQQTVVAEIDDFEVIHRFGDPANSNISLGLQFYKKKEKQTVADQLSAVNDRLQNSYYYYGYYDGYYRRLESTELSEEEKEAIEKKRAELEEKQLKEKEEQQKQIQRASKYLEINGMVELKNGSHYTVFNPAINSDVYTWKQYNDSKLYENKHHMLELKLNLSDAAIKGTENHLDQMEVVSSRFQIRYDLDQTKIDAYKECLKNTTCAQLMGDSIPTILQDVYEQTFKGYETMTTAQRTSATDTFKYMQELAESDEDAKMLKLYDAYYLKYLPLLYADKEKERQPLTNTLNNLLYQSFTSSEDYDKFNQAYTSYANILKVYKSELKTLDSATYERVVTLTNDLDLYQAKYQNYEERQDQYVDEINGILQQFDVELIIYDEVEYFRDTSDQQFNYPFQQRKNKIDKLAFQSSDSSDDTKTGNYQYPKQTLKFQPSLACLEPSVMEQLNFISKLIQDILSVVNRILSGNLRTEEVPSDSKSIGLEKCSDQGFLKLKYVSSQEQTLSYLDDYETGVISNRILLEVKLEMDAFKTESLRTSTQILDFLGDMGGFYQAVDLIIFLVAEYFSARFFLASIAANLYLLKESKKSMVFEQIKQGFLSLFVFKPKDDDEEQIQADDENEFTETFDDVRKNYKHIHIRPVHLMFDPLFKSITSWCRPCCRKKAFLRREKVLDQCNDKFTEELEITALLAKIRDMHEMFKFIKTQRQSQLLTYHEDRVIQLSDNSDLVSSSSSDEGSKKSKDQDSSNLPQVETDLKFADCVTQDFQNAINFSVIQGASINQQRKNKFLELMIKREGVVKSRASRSVEPSSKSPLPFKLPFRAPGLDNITLGKAIDPPPKKPAQIKKTLEVELAPLAGHSEEGHATARSSRRRQSARMDALKQKQRHADNEEVATAQAPETSIDAFLLAPQEGEQASISPRKSSSPRKQSVDGTNFFESTAEPARNIEAGKAFGALDVVEELGASKRKGRSKKKRLRSKKHSDEKGSPPSDKIGTEDKEDKTN